MMILFLKTHESNNPLVWNIWSSAYENNTNADFTKNNTFIILINNKIKSDIIDIFYFY